MDPVVSLLCKSVSCHELKPSGHFCVLTLSLSPLPHFVGMFVGVAEGCQLGEGHALQSAAPVLRMRYILL